MAQHRSNGTRRAVDIAAVTRMAKLSFLISTAAVFAVCSLLFIVILVGATVSAIKGA